MKYFLLLSFLAAIFFYGCNESVSPEKFDPLEVDIRMEVQILDSTYQLYSRPFTEIYFTCYKKDSEGLISNIEKSDTTSCRNGWGVKLLNFTFTNQSETIVLGASCDSYEGSNYREVTIEYDEAELRTDSTNHSSIIKTFAIYYN